MAMDDHKLARASRYLLYFTLAVLPLERIPSLEATFPFTMTIRLSQLSGLVLILLNLPLLWRSRGLLVHSRWRWLAAFWGVCVLSAAWAGFNSRSLAVVLFTVFVGVLAWVVALRFERDKIEMYLKILVGSALATCAFGFYQFFGDLFGLPPAWTGLREAYTKVVFGFPRIQSTGLEPLYFGNFLLIACGLLIVAAINGYRQRWALWAFVPIATVVWLTVSRGAMVALGILGALAAVVGLWRRRWANVGRLAAAMVVSMGLAVGIIYLGSQYVVQLKTAKTNQALQNFSKQSTNISTGESSTGRARTRNLALKAFATHPVLGIGPGNFGAYAAREMPRHFSGTSAIVNNEPLELLAETGLVGLASLVVFVAGLLWAAVRMVKTKLIEYVMAYGLVLFVSGTALQYQTFSTLYITHIWVAVGLLAGFVMGAVSRKRAGGRKRAEA